MATHVETWRAHRFAAFSAFGGPLDAPLMSASFRDALVSSWHRLADATKQAAFQRGITAWKTRSLLAMLTDLDGLGSVLPSNVEELERFIDAVDEAAARAAAPDAGYDPDPSDPGTDFAAPFAAPDLWTATYNLARALDFVDVTEPAFVEEQRVVDEGVDAAKRAAGDALSWLKSFLKQAVLVGALVIGGVLVYHYTKE